MRIHRIIADVNHYQSLSVENAGTWHDAQWSFDCSPKMAKWESPRLFVLHPKLKRGNFFYLSPGAIAIDLAAISQLQDLLEMSGELLPINDGGIGCSLLNVTECINALDDDGTEWAYGKSTGARLRIQRYAFHANRLTETPLFKIPETCKSEILTVEGRKDPEDEFKYRVEKAGLTGLVFEEIWNDGT